MNDFRDIEIKSSRQSLVVTIVVGALTLSMLLITIKFEIPSKNQNIQPIEIAMNFGTSNLGQGVAEPMPSVSQAAASSSEQSQAASSELENVATQQTTKSRPVAAPTPSTQTESQTSSQPPSPEPQGDVKGATALQQLLGGRGQSPSDGDGSDGVPGNVGDPKGGEGDGDGIGENWLSTIPEPQRHDCASSGVIVVDIIVNANGGIKSAIPGGRGSTSSDPCLRNKAKSLVEEYVRAHPGTDGRRGSYRVNLR